MAMRYVRDARRDATHGMEWLAVGNLGRRDLCAIDGWMDGWMDGRRRRATDDGMNRRDDDDDA